jgi:hypothetical protein
MGSWRETASVEAQGDLDKLTEAALRMAHKLLEKNGEFFPFALAADSGGNLAMVGADPGLGDKPPSEAVRKFLFGALKAGQERFRAAVVVSDITLKPRREGIRIELEHRDGIAIIVVEPYEKTWLGKRAYLPLQAAAGTPQIWVQ